MKARMELSQKFFGFKNWIHDHIGPRINLIVNEQCNENERFKLIETTASQV